MDFFNDIFHNLALLEFYFLNIIYILLYIEFILSIFFQHSNILTRASHHWCLASNIVLVHSHDANISLILLDRRVLPCVTSPTARVVMKLTLLSSVICGTGGHLNGNVVNLTAFSSLAVPKVVILTTFGAASDEKVVNMTLFPFQWLSFWQRPMLLLTKSWHSSCVKSVIFVF